MSVPLFSTFLGQLRHAHCDASSFLCGPLSPQGLLSLVVERGGQGSFGSQLGPEGAKGRHTREHSCRMLSWFRRRQGRPTEMRPQKRKLPYDNSGFPLMGSEKPRERRL